MRIARDTGSVILTVSSTASPATDLGYLLHKHPDRVQSFELPLGTAHVFYPEADESRCTAALLLEVDPIGLVQRRRSGVDGFALAQYVNDRPYAASSMLAVAISRVFGTALRGECVARPALAAGPLPLTITVPAVPCLGGAALAHDLFAPLGWDVTTRTEPLDLAIGALTPDRPWGDSRYVDLTLVGHIRLADALTQLYVLLPVLDGAKHYWVGPDEIDKLLGRGGDWLQSHPQRDLILRRYLAHQRSYVEDATARLDALDGCGPDTEIDDGDTAPPPRPLLQYRRTAVLTALRDVGAHRVVDLGCGEGTLLRDLLDDPTFTEIVGVDVSAAALDRAARRLDLERMPERRRSRIELHQSSATYRDRRMARFDAMVLMEVVEHVDPDRLAALERSVFAQARSGAVVMTTPNAEFNVRYAHLAAGMLRHPDHRFEWTRTEFAGWADGIADRHGYQVEFRPVGEADPELGAPTQLALFTRRVDA